jgi:hypothetical protein
LARQIGCGFVADLLRIGSGAAAGRQSRSAAAGPQRDNKAAAQHQSRSATGPHAAKRRGGPVALWKIPVCQLEEFAFGCAKFVRILSEFCLWRRQILPFTKSDFLVY